MRQYHVVVWGATGFTGKLICEHIIKRYMGEISWAIAGRNEKKLLETRRELSKLNTQVSDIDIIKASLDDLQSLDAMAQKTLVLITMVGPYAKYGTPLVEACIRSKTHMCDLTAEVHWVKQLIPKYHDQALQNGVKIVNFCGFEVVPLDIGAFMVSEYINTKYGTQANEIQTVLEIEGGGGVPSGGTMDSAMGFLEQPKELQKECHSVYCLTPENSKKFDAQEFYGYRYDKNLKSWVAGSIFQINSTRTFRRTNYLLDYKYGTEVVYNDYINARYSVLAFLISWFINIAIMLFQSSLTRNFCRSLLPQAGSGPSRYMMENGGWTISFHGYFKDPSSNQQKHAYGSIKGVHDPGYMDTTLMMLEVALALALQNQDAAQKGHPKGGIMTPAAAGGSIIFDRLKKIMIVKDVKDEPQS